MLYTPLEQFLIISLLSIKLFCFDFSITNLALVNFLVLFTNLSLIPYSFTVTSHLIIFSLSFSIFIGLIEVLFNDDQNQTPVGGYKIKIGGTPIDNPPTLEEINKKPIKLPPRSPIIDPQTGIISPETTDQSNNKKDPIAYPSFLGNKNKLPNYSPIRGGGRGST